MARDKPHSAGSAEGGFGRLYLVATPIGNLEDFTLRAVRVLREVDLVAAEDTRTARVLFGRHQITTPTISMFEGNESGRVATLIGRLKAGESVAVISEAGTPLLSDPGLPLVRACVAEGIELDVIPGPSAITTALLLSGFAVSRFRFIGFPPRQGGPRERLLTSVAADPDAVVLFESPRRLLGTLKELGELLGQRPLAVVREMTKLHQQVCRGTAQQLRTAFEAVPARGEITIVVSEMSRSGSTGSADLPDLVREHLARGSSPREAARELSELGYSKRTAYQLALSLARRPADDREDHDS